MGFFLTDETTVKPPPRHRTPVMRRQNRGPANRQKCTESPFGVLIAEWGPAKDVCPFRFMTKYYDREIEAYNFGIRIYDPQTGKWYSNDPLGIQGGINLTAFCRNDPVNRYDALGLFPVDDPSVWSKVGPNDAEWPMGVPAEVKSVWLNNDTGKVRIEGLDDGPELLSALRSSVRSAAAAASANGDEWVFVEEVSGSTRDGWHTIDTLRSLTINTFQATPEAKNLLAIANTIGCSKAYVKTASNGRQYLILKVKAGTAARAALRGNVYSAANPRVTYIAEALKPGIRKATVGFAIISTVGLNVLEGVLDHKTLTEVGISTSVDVVVQGIGIVAGAGASIIYVKVCAWAGTIASPGIGTGIGLVVGVVTCTAVEFAVHEWEIKQRIQNAIQLRQKELSRQWNGWESWIDEEMDAGRDPFEGFLY